VMTWACFAVESTTVARPPVDSEYLLALASLAVWDAILAIEEPGNYEPYASSPLVLQPASSDAAVATEAGAKLGREVCRNFLADHLRRVDDDNQGNAR
jgi:hypothetical protein